MSSGIARYPFAAHGVRACSASDSAGVSEEYRITGMRAVAGSCRRRAQSENPERSGSSARTTTRSGRRVAMSSSASAALAATAVAQPSSW